MKEFILKLAARFQEDGQALAEYSLILAFIFAVCVVALGVLGVALSGKFDEVAAGLP